MNAGFNWSYFMGRGAGPLEVAFNNTASGTGSYWSIRDPVNGNTTLGNFSYPAWTANAWYHLAYTYDGSTANLYLTPLQNATGVTLLTTSSLAANKVANGGATGLGLGNTDGNKYSMGMRLDWAAVYDGALSSADLYTDLQQNAPVAAVVPEPVFSGVLLSALCVLRMRRGRRIAGRPFGVT